MTKKPSRVKNTDDLRYQALLKNINQFIRTHQNLTYPDFDYYVVHDLALFSVSHNVNLHKIERQVQEIVKSLGVIMNIFNNPTIVLKDTTDVLPVENAKIVNQNTLLHLANHSHLMSNVTDSGVKPKKLLTRVYEDDYSLYENQIFCNLIDEITHLVKKNRNYLNGLLYAEGLKAFNFSDQINHSSYFLTLGKLHAGYSRNHSQNLASVHRLLDQTQLILQTISPLLSRPVYKKNLKRDKYLELRKTNIFRMQSDYRRIYKTYRFLQQNNDVVKEVDPKLSSVELRRGYMRYVLILTLFAIGHFNFETDAKMTFDLKNIKLNFIFKKWTLTIENTKQNDIILRFNKDKAYNIMLVDSGELDMKMMKKRREHQIHEIVTVSDLNQSYLTRDFVYISTEDIDSFRRIQQILLKGMIQVDESHRVCPFCGGQLSHHLQENQYFCRSCMTETYKAFCPNKKREFYYTDCKSLRELTKKSISRRFQTEWSYQKLVEAQLYFRNITKIDEEAQIICPHCQEVHHSVKG